VSALCEIEVRLDPPGPVEVGSAVTVYVRATAREPARCARVRCEVSWTTHCRGERDRGTALATGVPGGDIAEGVALERTFRFVVPETGPVTYRGLRLSRQSVLSIEWQVRVWLDGHWARDPECVVPLEVVPRSI
jgi:hypothetical protein